MEYFDAFCIVGNGIMWDLPNLIVCLIAVALAYSLGKIKSSHACCLALLSFTPYLMNGVLLEPEYMPDQFKYWDMLSAIRSFKYTSEMYHGNVTPAAYMWAFLPLPFVETINSIGFFNKFIMILIFIWASSSLKLQGWVLWFLLLFPSIILYSSLSLRDMLICALMLSIFWSVIRRKYWLAILFLILLEQIKFQNAALVVLFSIGYVLVSVNDFSYSKNKVYGFVLLLSLFSIVAFYYLGEAIEHVRFSMFLEDSGGDPSEYLPLNGFLDLIVQGFVGIVKVMFFPLPWQANSTFQLLQSIENIAAFVILVVFTVSCYKIIPKQTLYWLLFLLTGFFLYGLVVTNLGTIARYKLPFIVVYLIFLSYERVRFNYKMLVSNG